MALELTNYQVMDYMKSRMEKYKTEVQILKDLVENPPPVESESVIDNQTQDILLLLMEDEIVTTQVRLESSTYLTIIPQVSAFRDFLNSQRFLVGMFRKDHKVF